MVQVCCSSPERFLRCKRNGELEARPIKGTAPRGADAAADAAAAAALAASEKDQAENLMIVDLLRNDLGRVCEVRLQPHTALHSMPAAMASLMEQLPNVLGVADRVRLAACTCPS